MGNGKANEPDRRSLVVVLGMERSGTSALTEAISTLGYPLSDTPSLFPGKRMNERGVFEDRRIRDYNQQLIERHGCTPTQPWAFTLTKPSPADLAATRDIWQSMDAPDGFLIKDPKLCITLPWWLPHWPTNTTFVLITRHPREVSASIASYRRMFHPEGGFDTTEVETELAWYAYVRAAFAQTAGRQRILVNYATLMEQPRTEMERIRGLLSSWTGKPTVALADDLPLFANLRHNIATEPPLLAGVAATWQQIESAIDQGYDPGALAPAPDCDQLIEVLARDPSTTPRLRRRGVPRTSQKTPPPD